LPERIHSEAAAKFYGDWDILLANVGTCHGGAYLTALLVKRAGLARGQSPFVATAPKGDYGWPEAGTVLAFAPGADFRGAGGRTNGLRLLADSGVT
jgi:hypothetical protein